MVTATATPPAPYKNLPPDEHGYVPHTFANDMLVPDPDWVGRLPITENEIRRHNKLTANIYHRTPNGAHDSHSILLVIDALMRSKPGARLRSRYVSRQLQATRPLFIWDNQTVGRIIGAITDKAAAAYEAYRWTPIQREVDMRGQVFIITRHPETYRWFWKMMKQLGERASNEMVTEATTGEVANRKTSPLDMIDTGAPNPEDTRIEYP